VRAANAPMKTETGWWLLGGGLAVRIWVSRRLTTKITTNAVPMGLRPGGASLDLLLALDLLLLLGTKSR